MEVGTFAKNSPIDMDKQNLQHCLTVPKYFEKIIGDALLFYSIQIFILDFRCLHKLHKI